MHPLFARRRWLLPVLVLPVLAAAALLGGGVPGCGGATSKDTQYYCPMHPTYVSDRPGDCPICNMRLVEVEKGAAPSGATPPPQAAPSPAPPAATGPAAAYVCPMHPDVTAQAPGECPKCGMALMPVEPAATPAGDAAPAPGERRILRYRNPMDPRVTSPVPMQDAMGMDYVPVYADEVRETSGGVAGLAPVSLDARARSLAGIQTAPAQHEPLAQALRTVGTVVPDERRVRVVHTKVSGWIDKLYVNFTGQEVRRGQPVLGIYSPELLATQEEFLRALEASRRLAGVSPEAAESGAKLLQAARRRLELFDVPASFIEALERSGEAQRSVTLVAPNSGHVTSKGVFEGQTVEPGMELFTVTDLSRVWIVANVYEYEAPLVHEGQHATLSLPFDPSVRLDGRVAYVNPYLDAETRTLEVRFEFPNRDLVLKPAMYVDVSLHADDRMGIVIPESALLDSGLRKVVFVETSPGRFEPREVRTGVRGDGKVQVVSGVQAGERVVVRANFLLDSESRLRSALGATNGSAGPDR